MNLPQGKPAPDTALFCLSQTTLPDLTEIYEKYARHVTRHLCAALSCSYDDAEDAVQTAFAKLLEKRYTISSHSAFNLLLVIARNKLIEQHRSMRRYESLTPASPDDRPIDIPYVHQTSEPDLPDDKLRQLPQLLAGLPERVAAVIRLHFIEGRRITDIACVIGRDASTVTRTIAQGLKLMRRRLGVPQPKAFRLNRARGNMYRRRKPVASVGIGGIHAAR